jgi:hypothetical protein
MPAKISPIGIPAPTRAKPSTNPIAIRHPWPRPEPSDIVITVPVAQTDDRDTSGEHREGFREPGGNNKIRRTAPRPTRRSP